MDLVHKARKRCNILRRLPRKSNGRQYAMYYHERRKQRYRSIHHRRVTWCTARPCVQSHRTHIPICTTFIRHTIPHVAHHHHSIIRALVSTFYGTLQYTYNLDSKVILVDNCCSASTTNDLKDFISAPKPVQAKVEGYSWSTTATHVGTVHWYIEDDLGNTHAITLPNTYYTPSGKYKLSCPQNWARVAKDDSPKPNGTWCATYSDRIVLYWNQRCHLRTLQLIPSMNVGILMTSTSIAKYTRVCKAFEQLCPAFTTTIQPVKTITCTITPDMDKQPSSEPSNDPE